MYKIHIFVYNANMDYGTFKDNVRRAGLGIKELAGYIGMNHRSISNYSKAGVVPDHLAIIAVMLMELKRRDVEVKEIFEKIDRQGRQQSKQAERVKM